MSDPSLSLTASSDDLPHVEVFYAPPQEYPRRYWLNVVLFLLTIFSTLVVGSRMQVAFNSGHSPLAFDEEQSVFPLFPLDVIYRHPQELWLGVPYAASLMLILFAHEMGHYLMCVRYGVSATLPFFIPTPLLIGTMGAFIRIRAPIRSRTALFDIGIAGPIAGFIVACVMLAYALGLSRIAPAGAIAAGISSGEPQLQYPLIFPLMRRVLLALGLLHGPAAGPSILLFLHPVAIAAWFGMFATALNLLPGGQLDGGHIVYSLAPRAHRIISRITILVLIPLAVYKWAGWLIWAVLLEISSMRRPEVGDWPKVTGFRRVLAGFAVVMLVLTLTPDPFTHASLKEFLHPLRDWLRHLLHFR
jgi:membrane-associated protease RseP (regulator of RpoE activity)